MNASIFKRTSVAIAATAVALMFAMPARAVHLDKFQLDGDAYDTTCGGAFGTLSCDPGTLPLVGTTPSAVDDWNSLYSCPTSGTNLCQKQLGPTFNSADVIGDIVDEFNLPDSDNLSQGTKDDMNVTAWHWAAASGSAKTNIMQSFAAKYDANLYVAGNRDINNGDANFGVWLLQNATAECTAVMVSAGQCASAGTFVGKPNAQGFRDLVPHRIGDVLVVSAFTNGGSVANIQVYKVIQTVGNDSNPNAVPGTCPATAFDGYAGKSTGSTGICLQQLIDSTVTGKTAACNDAKAGIPADAACAATNAAPIASLDPRFLSSQSGSIKGQYPALTFFEVGLDLVNLSLATECFPNYIVEGRQSQSVTSSLNDFTLGTFQSCDAGIKTQASGPVTVGATITDTATLAGTTGGPTPTGSITFNAYSDSSCTTQVFTSTKTVSGFGDYGSDAYTTTATGTIYWIASYTGDANFPAAAGTCGDANESSVVNKATPSISTTQSSTTANIGDKIWDTATLSNAYGSATGTITFTLYGPGDTTCSSALATYVVNVSTNGANSKNTNPTNVGFTVTTAGTYRWIASYSGDSNNAGANDGNALATSGCTAEPVVVAKNSPTIQTTPKVQLIMTDVAALSGFAGTPTGTFSFFLYQNDPTCSSSLNQVYSITNVAYNGTITGATTTSGTLPSGSTYYSSNTAFKWVVTYSGDANNNSASSACGEPVSVSFQ